MNHQDGLCADLEPGIPTAKTQLSPVNAQSTQQILVLQAPSTSAHALSLIGITSCASLNRYARLDGVVHGRHPICTSSDELASSSMHRQCKELSSYHWLQYHLINTARACGWWSCRKGCGPTAEGTAFRLHCYTLDKLSKRHKTRSSDLQYRPQHEPMFRDYTILQRWSKHNR